MQTVFRGSFTQQEPIPDEAIAAATEVMRSGRLHRYNTIDGDPGEVARLELEFRDYIGAQYCLAVTSGGYALTTALRAAGLGHGDVVLTNGFTLSPVPGAILAAGGRPVLIETTEQLVIDLEDLLAKAVASRARYLLLSHMRGHIVDMDALQDLARRCNLKVIEDCAHTMGAGWNGKKSGRHGLVACYSTQTYKHLNSGEGGLIASDDADLMARATILSGSYMLYGRHPAGPPPGVYTDIRLKTPNCSGRLDNLRAAILRPQLVQLDRQCARWNERYHAVADALAGTAGLELPRRPAAEQFVASSIQFRVPRFDPATIRHLLVACHARGVELKWFGANEPQAYTSNHRSWRYIGAQALPRTDRVLTTTLDMRLPLTLSIEDCRLIATIIREEVEAAPRAAATGTVPGPAPEIA
jgi:dTDP-4-amino-4,6-dideoxygalactose transaminase